MVNDTHTRRRRSVRYNKSHRHTRHESHIVTRPRRRGDRSVWDTTILTRHKSHIYVTRVECDSHSTYISACCSFCFVCCCFSFYLSFQLYLSSAARMLINRLISTCIQADLRSTHRPREDPASHHRCSSYQRHHY